MRQQIGCRRTLERCWLRGLADFPRRPILSASQSTADECSRVPELPRNAARVLTGVRTLKLPLRTPIPLVAYPLTSRSALSERFTIPVQARYTAST